jgi:hypothetical protein
MTAISKKIAFKVLDHSDLPEKTIEYFKQSGFKHIVSSPNDKKIRFERGSIASNMWTFNPLKWKSEIDIEINGQEVKANLSINAAGQITTNKDIRLWEKFIDNYQKYLNKPNFDFLIENSRELKTTKSKNLKYIGWAVLGGLIGGIPAGLIAYWTGLNTMVSIGAAGGAIALLTKKIHDEKKKNSL